MVRIESSFTLDQLMKFSKSNYEAFNIKSRLRKYAYYRQVAAYIAVEGGCKISHIAKALGVSHPTIIWSRDNATSRLISKDEKFMEYYKDFVDKFNKHLNQDTTNELPTPVNAGERVDS